AVSKLDLAGSGWTQAVPGMGGVVTVDGSVDSNGDVAKVQGKVQAEKLKLSAQGTPAAKMVAPAFTLHHKLQARSGQLIQGGIHIGAAKASLTGTYGAAGESTVLHMTLAGSAMPVPELAAMLPALGVVLPAGSSLQGGTASLLLTMEGPADRLI